VSVPFDDRGLALGDGLFETLLALDGRAQQWEEHVARLTWGCEVIGLPAPNPAELEAQAAQAMVDAGLTQGRAALRLNWSAGSGGRGLERPDAPAPRLWATAAPSPLWDGPARLALADVRRNEGSPTSRLKTLSYIDNVLARTQARTRGADEAVMLNTHGEIACAAAANLFWITAGRIFTPALDCGAFAGVVRAKVMRAGRRIGVEVTEIAAPASALRDAESVFLTNSLIGVRPVSGFEEAVYAPSPLIERLAREI
jgi:branched-subunit amino acid aminotransferase/4-amino-4-deoxychorismate lyase